MRERTGSHLEYMREIGSYRQITPKREVELSNIINGKRNEGAIEEAITELVHANLRLVVHCVNEFLAFLNAPACTLTRSDLIGEGNVGLLKAARSFNANHVSKHTKGRKNQSIRFSTYAYQCIRSQILRALKRARLVHIPDQHFGYWRKIRDLRAKHGTSLTDAMLCKKLGVTRKGLDRLKTSMKSSTYMLEDMYRDDDSANWADQIPNTKSPLPEDVVSRKDLRRFLMQEMKTLPPRTRRVVSEVFFKPEKPTLTDLARTFGFSRERARQVFQRGLALLRRRLTDTLTPEDRSALFASTGGT